MSDTGDIDDGDALSEEEAFKADMEMYEGCTLLPTPDRLAGDPIPSLWSHPNLEASASPVGPFAFHLDRFWQRVITAAGTPAALLPPDKRIIIEMKWTAVPDTLRAIIENK